MYTYLSHPICTPTAQWCTTRLAVSVKRTRKKLPSGLKCGTNIIYNYFMRQWACSIFWEPRQWNLGWDLLRIASTHTFNAYTPIRVSERIFWFKYLYLLVPILWPEQAWVSKKYTPCWYAILVVDAIQRYFELQVSFSLLGMSLYMWRLMALVISLGNLLSF